METTIPYHLKHPGQSVSDYIASKIEETGREIRNLRKIYLDTNFWIQITEVELGRNKRTEWIELKDRLDDLSESGNIICPFSQDIWVEFFRQTDPKTLGATACVLDRLSKKIAFRTRSERYSNELYHGIQLALGRDPNTIEPIENHMWTRIVYVSGMRYPETHAFDQPQRDAIAKSWVDHAWNLGFEEVCRGLSDCATQPPVSRGYFDRTASRVNGFNAENSETMRSRKHAIECEFAGVLDYALPDLAEICKGFSSEAGFASESIPEEEHREFAKQIAVIILEGFRKNKLGTSFPTLQIDASIYGAARWDKKRRILGNDILDFSHASMALPYCDYFFTETSLAHLIRNALSLDSKFDCKVSSTASNALKLLQEI